MAIIVIKDLPASAELDRQAMLAVIGGSRFRSGAGRPAQQRVRLFDIAGRGAGKPAAAKAPGR